MSGDRFTSRRAEAGRKLYECLSLPDVFPAHDVTGVQPRVSFGDDNPDAGAERVSIIATTATDEASQEWARFGKPGRDERFTLTLVGRSLVPVPGQTDLDIWNRLEQLTDAIQNEIVDPVTHMPRLLGFSGEVAVGHAMTPDLDVVPSPQGPMGWFSIAVRLQAQI